MAVFILTAKVNKRRLALILACAALVVAGVWWSAARGDGSAQKLKTEEERVGYLQDVGWQVSPQATLVEELQMPEKFGNEYERYLALQAGQGFDLTKYAGKRIKRYTYAILNHPSGNAGTTAHLLTCKDVLIGGEVLGNGFLHGLEMPEG